MSNIHLKQFRRDLHTHNIDAAYIVWPEHMQYLTGFYDSDSRLIVSQKSLAVLSDPRVLDLVRNHKTKFTCFDISSPAFKNSWVTWLNSIPHLTSPLSTRGRKNKTIGFEANHLTVAQHARLKKIFPHGTFAPIDSILETSRAIKQPDEIDLIKQACQITHRAYQIIKPRIKSGMTELAVAWQLEKIMRELGATGLAFPTIVATGPNSAIPHAQPTTRTIKKNDIVLLDFGAKIGLYHADMTRTFFVGSPSTSSGNKLRNIYDIAARAQQLGIKAARAGAFIHKVDNAVRDYIRAAGFADNFTHATGHGVGLEIHEAPAVSKKHPSTSLGYKLTSNMIITVEPGIYLPGIGGVRIEDTIRITKNKPEILTK